MNKSNKSELVEGIGEMGQQFLFDLGEQPVKGQLTDEEKAAIQAELDAN
jgi:hypothetical protein